MLVYHNDVLNIPQRTWGFDHQPMAALPGFLDTPQQQIVVENHAASLGRGITISKDQQNLQRHESTSSNLWENSYGFDSVSTQLVKILDVPCIIYTKMQL